MTLIQGKNISFGHHYGDQIFADVNFFITKKSKIGVIGKNGTGKSSLLNLIGQAYKNNYSGFYISRGVKIGYLQQDILEGSSLTGMEYLWHSRPKILELKKLIDGITQDNIDNFNPDIFSEYNEIGGYDFEEIIRKHMGKFRLDDNILHKNFSQMSGGEKLKIALIHIILKEPNLILLDEPTNHLDREAVILLEDYLRRSISIPFLVVSHDRLFLDRTVTEIWELHSGEIKKYQGNYTSYINEKNIKSKQADLEIKKQKSLLSQLKKSIDQKNRDIQQNNKFKEPRSIKKNGGICKRDAGYGSAKFNASKLTNANKNLKKRVTQIEKTLADIHNQKESKSKITFQNQSDLKNKVVLDLKNVTKFFDRRIFNNIDLTINNRDRIAFIGENGSGKTTLLKIIAGLENPTEGSIYRLPSQKLSYYSQEHENINLDNTIIEEIMGNNHIREHEVRTMLACLDFKKESIMKKVRNLSLGERSKVAMVKILMNDSNILLLDEPMNHLDIRSKEILEEAFLNYNGTILFVSHDRMFIKKISTKIYDIKKGRLL